MPDDDTPIWTDAECNRWIWTFAGNAFWAGLCLGVAAGLLLARW